MWPLYLALLTTSCLTGIKNRPKSLEDILKIKGRIAFQEKVLNVCFLSSWDFSGTKAVEWTALRTQGRWLPGFYNRPCLLLSSPQPPFFVVWILREIWAGPWQKVWNNLCREILLCLPPFLHLVFWHSQGPCQSEVSSDSIHWTNMCYLGCARHSARQGKGCRGEQRMERPC